MASTDLATTNPTTNLLMRVFQANQNIAAADKSLKRAKENKKAALMVRERLDQEIESWAEGGQIELDVNVTRTAKPAKKAKPKKKTAKNRAVAALKP